MGVGDPSLHQEVFSLYPSDLGTAVMILKLALHVLHIWERRVVVV
jgi:hypothetical protein